MLKKREEEAIARRLARGSNSDRKMNILNNKRANIMIQSLVTFVCQMILVTVIIYEITTEKMINFFIFDYAFTQVFARFICTLILHLYLLGELTGALERMKFVLNHEYKFAAPGFAFANTVTQSIAIIFVEMCSLLVIL